jgi:hypothetical protein
MLKLLFEGYYQMRMATDPDPPDDPRGLSGYTFALPGEPDFDRKLHFQPDENGAYQRVYGLPGARGPQIGVQVVDAMENGTQRPDLKGSLVRFVDAGIVERNGVIVRNDMFVIDPLRVRIEQVGTGSPLLDRVDYLSGDPNLPNLPVVDATKTQLERRQLQGGFTDGSWKVALATGLPGPNDDALVANRRERQRNLIALRDTIDRHRQPGEYAGLTTRITQLDLLKEWWDLTAPPGAVPLDRRARQLALLADGWNIDINGQVLANAIGADEKKLWNLSFWMGGWDGDALCGFIQGELNVPLLARD